MSLDYTLLGYLRTPSTGYDLGRTFAEGGQHFWYAELSQIYPTLKRLEGKGWLRGRDVPSPVGPTRRVYRITAAGRAALGRWLRGGPQIGRDRLPYIAQAYFLDALESPDEAIGVVRDMQAIWQGKLATLEQFEAAVVAEHGPWSDHSPAVFHPYTALRMGIHQYRAKLAWCDETLTRLDARRPAAVPMVR
jgi:DNA-binding PadR family transcriptional regulator